MLNDDSRDQEEFTPHQRKVIEGLLKNQEIMLKIVQDHKRIAEAQNRTIKKIVEELKRLKKDFEFSYN